MSRGCWRCCSHRLEGGSDEAHVSLESFLSVGTWRSVASKIVAINKTIASIAVGNERRCGDLSGSGYGCGRRGWGWCFGSCVTFSGGGRGCGSRGSGGSSYSA